MSIKLYIYKIEDGKLWHVINAINELYAEQHLLMLSLTGRVKMGGDKSELLKELFEIADHAKETEFQVTLQVFELNNQTYFRVLESTYMFMNTYQQIPYITPIFYDGRSESSEGNESKIALSDDIDTLIEIRHYLLYPVIDRDIVYSRAFELIRTN